MTDNRSPHWRQPRPGQSERNAELFAVLDRADVSEPVRDAVAYAINSARPPVTPTGHADALVALYLSERDRRDPAGRRPRRTGYDSSTRFTLHLTFAAADLDEARANAVTYAEGLAILRPELNEYQAGAVPGRRVAPRRAAVLWCGRPGRRGVRRCTRSPGLSPCGWHRWTLLERGGLVPLLLASLLSICGSDPSRRNHDASPDCAARRSPSSIRTSPRACRNHDRPSRPRPTPRSAGPPYPGPRFGSRLRLLFPVLDLPGRAVCPSTEGRNAGTTGSSRRDLRSFDGVSG
jgi:hypothetical protein